MTLYDRGRPPPRPTAKESTTCVEIMQETTVSSLEEHEEHSLEILGAPWTEVHEWFDQYFDEVPGAAHRVILHHRLGLALGVQLFGEQSRPALERHLLDDFEFIPDGPEDVARMMDDQGLLTFGQIETIKAVLVKRFPRVAFSFEGLGR